VEARIRTTFWYAFGTPDRPGTGYVPKLVLNRITNEPFAVLDERVTPIPLEHAGMIVLGFRIGGVAYCTDVNRIPDASWPLLEGLDVLILDALRHKTHVAHFGLNDALEVIAKLRPRQAYLTHMSHDIEHESVNRQLPQNVELAYDGLKFTF
jgi:phosphoribosyl 1,2-cyclic phosphate phosphodiesterase